MALRELDGGHSVWNRLNREQVISLLFLHRWIPSWHGLHNVSFPYVFVCVVCLQLFNCFFLSSLPERTLALGTLRSIKAESATNRSRKHLKKQQESVDSVDSSISSPSLSPSSSSSCLPHVTRKRFQIYSKSPFYRAVPSGGATALEQSPGHVKGLDDRPQFTTRGTFNPEKGKQKLKNVKNSPPKAKELPEGATGTARKRHPDAADYNSPQQLVLLGNNEFMV